MDTQTPTHKHNNCWKLLLRQKVHKTEYQCYGTFAQNEFTKNMNAPNSNLYSNLDIDYDEYRDSRKNNLNKMAFLILWPNIRQTQTNLTILDQLPSDGMIWYQSTTPIQNITTAEGYEEIDVPYPGVAHNVFIGMKLNKYKTQAFSDGNSGADWWYAVGANVLHKDGIPGPPLKDLSSGGIRVQHTEFYVFDINGAIHKYAATLSNIWAVIGFTDEIFLEIAKFVYDSDNIIKESSHILHPEEVEINICNPENYLMVDYIKYDVDEGSIILDATDEDEEKNIVLSNPRLFGINHVPYKLSFKLEFLKETSRKGCHGGVHWGSNDKNDTRWSGCVDESRLMDHKIHDSKTSVIDCDMDENKWRFYVSDENPEFNSKFVPGVRSFKELDGKRWEIVFGTNDKCTFFHDDVEIYKDFRELQVGGFIGFWVYGGKIKISNICVQTMAEMNRIGNIKQQYETQINLLEHKLNNYSLTEVIKEKDGMIKRKDGAIEKLMQSMEEKAQELNKLECINNEVLNKTNETRQQNQLLIEENDKCKNDINQKQSAMDELESKLNEKDKLSNELRKQNEELLNDKNTFNQEIEMLKDKNKTLIQQNEEYNKNINQMGQELNDKKEESIQRQNEYNNKIEVLMEEKNKLESIKNELMESNSENMIKIKTFEERILFLKERNEMESGEKHKLEIMYKELNDKFKELNAKFNQLKQNKKQIEIELGKEKIQKEIIMELNDKLSSDKNELKEKLNTYHIKESQQNAKYDELVKKYDEKKREYKNRNEDNIQNQKAYNNKIEVLMQEKHKLESINTELKESNDENVIKIKTFEQTLNDFKLKNDENETEIKTISDEKHKVEVVNEELNDKLNQLKQKKKELEIESAKEKKQKEELFIAMNKELNDKLLQKLNTYQIVETEQNAKYEGLSKKYNEIRGEYETKNEENNQLTERLNKLSQHKAMITNKLQDLSNKHNEMEVKQNDLTLKLKQSELDLYNKKLIENDEQKKKNDIFTK